MAYIKPRIAAKKRGLGSFLSDLVNNILPSAENAAITAVDSAIGVTPVVPGSPATPAVNVAPVNQEQSPSLLGTAKQYAVPLGILFVSALAYGFWKDRH